MKDTLNSLDTIKVTITETVHLKQLVSDAFSSINSAEFCINMLASKIANAKKDKFIAKANTHRDSLQTELWVLAGILKAAGCTDNSTRKELAIKNIKYYTLVLNTHLDNISLCE